MTDRNILILEDDARLGSLLKASLEKAHFNVSLHENATKALEELDTSSFDCIVADVFILKDGVYTRDGGVRLISTIKQVNRATIPIIAISGSFSSQQGLYMRTTAQTAGADALLAKPFSPQQLIRLIEDMLT